MPVTTMAPSFCCVVLGSPGVVGFCLAGSCCASGFVWSGVACANAAEDSMTSDEQHPPARSNARRACDEGFGTSFSPLFSLPDSTRDKPRTHPRWKRFHLREPNHGVCQARGAGREVDSRIMRSKGNTS